MARFGINTRKVGTEEWIPFYGEHEVVTTNEGEGLWAWVNDLTSAFHDAEHRQAAKPRHDILTPFCDILTINGMEYQWLGLPEPEYAKDFAKDFEACTGNKITEAVEAGKDRKMDPVAYAVATALSVTNDRGAAIERIEGYIECLKLARYYLINPAELKEDSQSAAGRR